MRRSLTLLFILSTLFSCNTENKQTDSNSSLTTSGKKYLIAFNVHLPDSSHINNYEIFTMNIDGSDQKNITNHPDIAWTYLSNKDEVFFVSDRDTCERCLFLYEMDSDGNNVRKITDFQLQDSWMGSRKDGQELVVKPQSQVDSLMYIIDRNGEILKKVETGTPYVSDPAFSPDGEKIAFIGKNKKSKKDPDFKAEIYTINPDGSDLKQLSYYPENDTTAQWFDYKVGPPRWHPTEDFISYQSKQKGKYSLYGVSLDGTKQWKLTENRMNEGWHSWSPDGNWLAIELFDTPQSQFHIGLMNWQTKEMKIVTNRNYKFQQAPVFLEITDEK